MGKLNKDVKYTQLSAMLVDNSDTVVAYGMIKDNAETGEVEITIPDSV